MSRIDVLSNPRFPNRRAASSSKADRRTLLASPVPPTVAGRPRLAGRSLLPLRTGFRAVTVVLVISGDEKRCKGDKRWPGLCRAFIEYVPKAPIFIRQRQLLWSAFALAFPLARLGDHLFFIILLSAVGVEEIAWISGSDGGRHACRGTPKGVRTWRCNAASSAWKTCRGKNAVDQGVAL